MCLSGAASTSKSLQTSSFFDPSNAPSSFCPLRLSLAHGLAPTEYFFGGGNMHVNASCDPEVCFLPRLARWHCLIAKRSTRVPLRSPRCVVVVFFSGTLSESRQLSSPRPPTSPLCARCDWLGAALHPHIGRCEGTSKQGCYRHEAPSAAGPF